MPKLSRLSIFCWLALSATVSGQSLDKYFELAYKGEVEEVSAAIPRLRQIYPDDGGLLFLQALITQDGDSALEMYKKVAQLYSSSPYADQAVMKIGEYLYSRGLYIQAAAYLKRIPIYYPRSELVYRGISLLLNSYLVAGDKDTAQFYARVFSKKYPEMDFDVIKGIVSAPSVNEVASALPGAVTASRKPAGESELPPRKDPSGEPAGTAQKRTNVLSEYFARVKAKDGEGGGSVPEARFQVQVGAFSQINNARRQKDLLEALNYSVEIMPTTVGGRLLHVVRVTGFESRDEARKVGTELKANYGFDFLIIAVN